MFALQHADGRPKERAESSREALEAVKDYLQPDCQKVWLAKSAADALTKPHPPVPEYC
jgi:hypothetical protein